MNTRLSIIVGRTATTHKAQLRGVAKYLYPKSHAGSQTVDFVGSDYGMKGVCIIL